MNSNTKVRIVNSKDGRICARLELEENEGILEAVKSAAFKILMKGQGEKVLTYERFNTLIRDWVPFGGIRGSL